MRHRTLWCSLARAFLLAGGLSGPVREARACGGAVEAAGGTVGMDAQRAFFSVQNNSTELVVQVFVPSSPGSYGMLVPVPAQPAIDPTPVSAAELDTLEEQTRPSIVMHSSGGGGLGCGGAAAPGGANPGGVVIGETVAIGPVTAVSLSADTGAALTAWLGQNGFALPASAQRVVDGYAAPGHWFVAIKRSGDPSGTLSSIGVHLTLPGDQRSYALRMASVGAASTVAFTVFVSAPVGVGPAAPYRALTLSDLDVATLQSSGYRAAVAGAVGAQANRAWVVEGIFDSAQELSGRLATLAGAGQRLTRLSTVMPAAALTEDVAFTGPAPTMVPTTVVLGTQGGDRETLAAWAAAALLLCGALRLRPRPREQALLPPEGLMPTPAGAS